MTYRTKNQRLADQDIEANTKVLPIHISKAKSLLNKLYHNQFTKEQKTLYNKLAPTNVARGNLNENTILSFCELVKKQVLQNRIYKDLENNGTTYIDANGIPRAHPDVSLYKGLSQNLSVLYREFGMTPIANSRVKENSHIATDELDELPE